MTIFCNHCHLPVNDGVRLASNIEWIYFHDSCWELIPMEEWQRIRQTYRTIGHYR